MSRDLKWTKKTVEVDVCVGGDLICDNCGKKLDVTDKKGSFYLVNSGHHEWGNDSVDSFNEEDACCEECMVALVKKRAEYWKDYCTVFIDVHRRRFSDIKRGDGECPK